MAKVIAILDLTGVHIISVIDAILASPSLSIQYTLRGIACNVSSSAAHSFNAKGIDLLCCNLSKPASIYRALTGVHSLFLATATTEYNITTELEQGKAIADAAVSTGIKHLIYTTLPSPSKITSGKYPIPSFDVKDRIKDYIRTLPIPSTFLSLGRPMQTFLSTDLTPRLAPDSTLAITNFLSSSTRIPLFDAASDTGLFISTIFAFPERFAGCTFCAATRLYSIAEIVATLSRVSGKQIRHRQVPREEYAAFLSGSESEKVELLGLYSWIEEYGYFGGKQDWVLKWAKDRIEGEMTEFEAVVEREWDSGETRLAMVLF